MGTIYIAVGLFIFTIAAFEFIRVRVCSRKLAADGASGGLPPAMKAALTVYWAVFLGDMFIDQRTAAGLLSLSAIAIVIATEFLLVRETAGILNGSKSGIPASGLVKTVSTIVCVVAAMAYGFLTAAGAAFFSTNLVPLVEAAKWVSLLSGAAMVVSTLVYWNGMLRLYAAPGAKTGGNV